MMKTICYVIAMEAEAGPFIEEYALEEKEGFFAPLPCRLYEATVNGVRLCVVLNGRQHGTDLVGCEAATVATLAAIQRLQPDLIVNSGTCGAWAEDGARIGMVYVGNGAMFHDRRVPGDDAWTTQSLGNYEPWDKASTLAQQLGMPMGKVTTGSSLDMQPCDEEIIRQNGGQLKDMEGAAVSFTASLMGVPVLHVKSVTDLCDSPAATLDQFKANLAQASQNLRAANKRVIDLLTAP